MTTNNQPTDQPSDQLLEEHIPLQDRVIALVPDGWHHLVYAAATSLAFTSLLRTRFKR